MTPIPAGAPRRDRPLAACHLLPSLDRHDGLCAYASALAGEADGLLLPHTGLSLARQDTLLVLHYSGYGYAANGVPRELIRQLGQWRQADPQRRLLVVFHELFARQPPWRKGFWWAPLQRRALRRLIRCCDGGFSTLQLHSAWLRRNGLEPFATLPVPSNVGETAEPLPLAQRQPRLVVFGGRGQRQAAYAALLHQPGLLRHLGIGAIDDVGPPLPAPAPNFDDLPLRCHGLLSEAEVARVLATSAVAAVSYPLPFLAKSGIFAAICAHGALPLVLNAGPEDHADGLSAGQQFITPARLQNSAWLERSR